MGSAKAAGRLDFIEGMRAAAALVVVVNHAYAQVWTPWFGRSPPASLSFLTYSLAVGHLAVSVFISISGFCLMLPVVRGDGTLRDGAATFFRRRARRILPPYYAALAGSMLLIQTVIGQPSQTLWDFTLQVRPIDLASHALLLQDFFGTGRINYAFWSIALEWQIYFLFPLLVLLFRRRGPLLATLLALAVGYATLLLPSARVYRAHLHYLGLFALGMAAAWAAFAPEAARLRERAPFTALGLLCAAAPLALMPLWGWQRSIDRWPLLDLLVSVATCCALVHASLREQSPARRIFSLPPLVGIGRFSYSLYLIHAPLLALLWIHCVRHLPLGDVARFWSLLFAGGAAIVGVSYVFFRAFEAPFLRPPAPRAEPQPAAPLG
jgi:peptidoglycan/LPS O-acetylase OafA/YrhL